MGTNYANYEELSMQSIFFWIFLNIFPPLWTVENVSCGMLIMQIYLQLSTDWILIIVSCIHTSCLCVLRGISNCSIGCVWRCSLQDGAMCQTARKIMTRMCWKKLCTVWWVLQCRGMIGTVCRSQTMVRWYSVTLEPWVNTGRGGAGQLHTSLNNASTV